MRPGTVRDRRGKPRQFPQALSTRLTLVKDAAGPAPCQTRLVAAIEVSDLRKSYGRVDAVRGLSFSVEPGEVYGLLGPNGAGKTTTVEILEGYRKRSAGQVWVLGHDPERRDRRLQERVGIVLQSSGLYPRVTVREAVAHFAKAYPSPRDADETIALVGLEDQADAKRASCPGASGGGSTWLWRWWATPS